MSIHLHGSWLVLIVNVQINFGVIVTFYVIFFLSIRQLEMLELNTKAHVMLMINPVFFLEKVLTIVLIET